MRPAGRLSDWAFGGALLAGAVVIMAAGPAPETIYPSDTANYLDACWDAVAGLRLQHDYFSPIGPAAILPTVVAMRLHGATVTAQAWGSALAWLGYGLVAWAVARRRMPGWLGAGFALFVAATAAAPYTLDFGNWNRLSYGMLYNRLAWAAVCIVACPAFLRGPGAQRLGWAAAGHGACAAWLWLIKPNYVLIQVPLTIWAMVSVQGQRRPFTVVGGFLAGAAVTTLLVGICVPFDPVNYVREHFAMAQDAPAGLLLYTLKRSLRENALPVALLGLGWLVATSALAARARRVSLVSLLLLIAGATFIANMTNCQFSEFPLCGAVAWFLAAFREGEGPRSRLRWTAAALGLVLGLGYAWQPWVSLPYALAWNRRHVQLPDARANLVASPAWTGMAMRYFPATPPPPPRGNPLGSAGDYATWLNDGLALLAQVQRPPGAILCLDWGNPFPFATGTRAARGDSIAWHVGRYLSIRHHPDAGKLLAQAAVVMEPNESVMPEALEFKRMIYREDLQANFILAREDAAWRVWVRSPPPPVSSPQ